VFEGVDTLVLHDELALEDILPFSWGSLSTPLPAATLGRYAEINARMLQVCLALDEQAPRDAPDDQTPQAAELARLDLKVNLLLDMLGRLLAQHQPRPAPARIRFNARGASWRPVGGADLVMFRPNTSGLLEIHLHESMLDPLRLVGRVSRVTQESVEVDLERSSDALTNLLAKFIFRQHRRRIADTRQAKGPGKAQVKG
jgi:hypothetical protein